MLFKDQLVVWDYPWGLKPPEQQMKWSFVTDAGK